MATSSGRSREVGLREIALFIASIPSSSDADGHVPFLLPSAPFQSGLNPARDVLTVQRVVLLVHLADAAGDDGGGERRVDAPTFQLLSLPIQCYHRPAAPVSKYNHGVPTREDQRLDGVPRVSTSLISDGGTLTYSK